MARDVSERAKTLLRQLLDAWQTGAQGVTIPLDAVEELVRGDAEATAATIPVLLKTGDRGMAQMAQVLATIYEQQHDDDSFVRLVDRAVASFDPPLKRVRVLPADGTVNGRQSDAARPAGRLTVMRITKAELAACDTYPVVRLFSADATSGAGVVRQLRFAVSIAYEVDDPREIWNIPQVRAYASRMFEQVPHLPYFLRHEPVAGMLLTFFGPLAPPEAIRDSQIDFMHPAVMKAVVRSMRAVRDLAISVGDDPRRTCTEALEAADDQYRTMVLDAVFD